MYPILIACLASPISIILWWTPTQGTNSMELTSGTLQDDSKIFCLSLCLNSFCSSKSCELQVRRMWLAKLVSNRKAKTSAVRCSGQENIYVKLCHMAYFCDLLFWPRSVAKQFYHNFYIPKPFRRDMPAPTPPNCCMFMPHLQSCRASINLCY